MHKMIVWTVAGYFVANALAGAALAQTPTAPETYPYGPHMGWWGGGWDGMFFGPLLMLLVIVAVVVTAILVMRRPGVSWQGTTQAPGRTPLDVLKERYARGEIDKADYEERRRVLGE